MELEQETGLFHIRDVPLDCTVLNEYMKYSPVSFSSVTVTELVVTISWASINDGCTITLDGVKATLCNRSDVRATSAACSPSSERTSNASAAGLADRKGELPVPSIEEREEDGVVFLANWIDIIISRFRVELKNIQVDLMGQVDVGSALRLSIDNINYFNSKPEADRHTNDMGSVASFATAASNSVSNVRGREQHAVASVMLLSSQDSQNSKVRCMYMFCNIVLFGLRMYVCPISF